MATLDERGYEILDSKPMEIPVGYRRPPSLEERMRAMVRNEISRRAQEVGQETFEEADDFKVDDDYDPRSPWELNFDQEAAEASQVKEGMTEQVAVVPKAPEAQSIASSSTQLPPPQSPAVSGAAGSGPAK